MEILSRPGGAKVFLDGEEVGKTPFTLRRVKEGHHRVRMEPPDWVDAQPVSIVMKTEPDPYFMMQAASGLLGIPGILIDGMAGTHLRYEPSEWRVDFLEPAPAPLPESSGVAAASPPEEPALPDSGAPPEESVLPESAAADGPSIDALLENIIHQDEK